MIACHLGANPLSIFPRSTNALNSKLQMYNICVDVSAGILAVFAWLACCLSCSMVGALLGMCHWGLGWTTFDAARLWVAVSSITAKRSEAT